ncbi:uncharacterized protein PHALS_05805 [Plasmopara halstedii]|uniref:Uncharacterized protein n=1 Tax=Plasmopara halstedii TaxID=4781 RepID=A0A0P1AA90_PLAHL|nr:uncharacterized protein PHALS_05805 [Plasmopara halstedii]CEG37750.1 hypothetical protein PHALS_05805 [Plasmopara halstedii]|eukprot:XP_024574119.1 hypothetical protein PHALS_05805 [Plasmopara halstedii]
MVKRSVQFLGRRWAGWSIRLNFKYQYIHSRLKFDSCPEDRRGDLNDIKGFLCISAATCRIVKEDFGSRDILLVLSVFFEIQ